ncbi:MAG: hypothetical protein ACXVLT_01320 [Flavisolibacter sp.]
MEQDKQLKEILLQSAERAPADFTDTVMKKVYGISTGFSHYQPLVSPSLKRKFIFAFGTTVIAILCLCLVIALADPKVIGWIKRIPLPDLNYNELLQFILIFWSLFALNMLFQKNFQVNSKA